MADENNSNSEEEWMPEVELKDTPEVPSSAIELDPVKAINDATFAASYAVAMGRAAASKAYEMVKGKGILYVRMISPDNNDTTGSNINGDVAALKNLIKRKKKKGKTIAKRAGASVDPASLLEEGAEEKLNEAETALAMLSSGFLPFEVQYNPASITMNTVGGNIQKYTAMGNDSPNSLVSYDKETSTYLSMSLIFEDINVHDAFASATAESTGVNVSQAVDLGKDLISNANGGYSVRVKVEGIFSLLRYKRTRQVIFVWNNMFFHGELLSVDAQYTMFNKLGNPIRAVVNLEIQQSNGLATFMSDMKYWENTLDDVFT